MSASSGSGKLLLGALGVGAVGTGIFAAWKAYLKQQKEKTKEIGQTPTPVKPSRTLTFEPLEAALQSHAKLGASNQSLRPLSPVTACGEDDHEKEMIDLFGASVAIVTLGVPGSGRASVVDTMRPWLGAWSFQTRHLTLANVLGQGYRSGGYSEDAISELLQRYGELTAVDGTAYVKLVCQRAWERSRSPTVFLISDLTSETEIRFLQSRFKTVIVLHVVNSPTVDPLPFADYCVRNTGTREELGEQIGLYFSGHILPALKGMMDLEDVRKGLESHVIRTEDVVYYDTNALFADPGTLFACMYMFAALLKTKNVHSKIDAIVAVSAKAVPLTTCLTYMLNKSNPSLLYHTHVHEDLVPYPVEWAGGESAVGPFAVGWAPHLLPTGSKILLVDDILASGRRASAVGDLAEKLGYEVAGLSVLFVIDQGDKERATLDFPLIPLLEL